MGGPHILVLPWPTQGHINPLMHFSVLASQHGIKVSFLNLDFIHITVTTPTNSGISLVSLPYELNDDGKNDVAKFWGSLMSTMPRKVEDLIHKLEGDDGITCIVADGSLPWVREVGMKLGIEVAMFWTTATALYSFYSTIDSMIHDGLLDTNGFPTRKGSIQISSSMPSVDLENMPWSFGNSKGWSFGNSKETTKGFFEHIKKIIEESKLIEWKLVNSTLELEPGAFSLSKTLLPIGPLIADYDTGSSGAQFWREDSTYLEWLDQQRPMSVIYASFGSTTELYQKQFQEILLGLELTNKPFLWVHRPGLTSGTHQDVQSNNGKIVGWVSQQKVLKHPAIACFVSHCGWNSTIEGLSNGVPFLCWPFLSDQFLNKDYICNIWKVGLVLQADEHGVVRKEEVKDKVEKLLGDETIKARSLKLKDLCRRFCDFKARNNF